MPPPSRRRHARLRCHARVRGGGSVARSVAAGRGRCAPRVCGVQRSVQVRRRKSSEAAQVRSRQRGARSRYGEGVVVAARQVVVGGAAVGQCVRVRGGQQCA